MAAAGFGIAPLKRHRLAVEIKQVGLDSLGRGKTFILRDKPLGGEIPVPRIGAQSHGAFRRRPLQKAGQEAEGKVVDGLEPQILERVDRGGAAGAGRVR
jgi:hypothetical protein